MDNLTPHFDFKMSLPLAQYHKHKLESRADAQAKYERFNTARSAIFDNGITNSSSLPEDDPRRVEYEAASAARSGSPWRDSLKELWTLIVSKDEKEKYDAAWNDFYFSDANASDDPKEVLSPDGAYKIVITSHKTTPGCWAYTKGTVFKMALGTWLYVNEVRRNYSSLWHEWVYREDGNWLLSGESYMGQTSINLATHEKYSFSPSEAYFGGGFCWVNATPNKDGTMIAAEGCHWGGPYFVQFYDWTDMTMPPMPIGNSGEHEECHGWQEDDASFLVGATRLIRLSDEVDVETAYDHDLEDADGNRIITDEEYDRLEDMVDEGDTSEAERRKISVLWERPPARKLYDQTVEYLGRLHKLAADYPEKYTNFDDSALVATIKRHWRAIPEGERPELSV